MNQFYCRIPTSPLSPDQLIICSRIWSSWPRDKVRSCLWNSLLLQSSPETIQATSSRSLFWNKGWICPLRFFKRSFIQGRKIGLLIDMYKIFGYQTCVVQAEVINISLETFSFSLFLRTFGIMQNGRKLYGNCVSNSAEIHLLHDCEDLVTMYHKLVSDLMDRMVTNLHQENASFGKLSEKFDGSVFILKNPNCFKISSLLLHSFRLGGILQ